MNIHWIGMALSATLGAASLRSVAPRQEAAPVPTETGETPSAPKAMPLPGGPGKQAGDLPGQAPRGFSDVERAEWRSALAQPDLERRIGVYLELVERASNDPLVEELLASWAQDGGDVELAWTARLGLREARSMRIRNRRGARRYSDLFAGLSVHLAEVPQGIIVAGPRGSLQGARGGRSSSRILRLQTGPTGVRVEVRDTNEAGARAEVFEAVDLAQLVEQHPELARDLASVRLVPDPGTGHSGSLPGHLRAQMEFSFDALWSGDAGLLRTDILGIQMREQRIDAEDAGEGGAAVGLLVERILPDTIAEVIALRRGDLLLELNSTSLLSGDDLSRVIKGREAAGAITVTLERDGSLRTLTWKPTIAVGETDLPVAPTDPVDPPAPEKPATDGE